MYDAFREKLLARIAAAKVGDPADPDDRGGAGRRRTGRSNEILAAIERGKAEGGTIAAGGERADDEGVPDRAHGVRERRRRRLPLLRGGVRAGHLALPLLVARRGARSAPTLSSSGCPRRSSPATSTRRSASRTSSRPASCTSTRRRPAPTCTCRSAASRAPRGARTSRDAQRWSSTPRPSPSTRTRHLAERVLVTGVLGCLGAWAASSVLDDGDRRRRLRPRRLQARLELVLGDDVARVELVRGDITELARARAGAGRARDHPRRPPRRAAGSVLSARTLRSGRGQRRRDDERLEAV